MRRVLLICVQVHGNWCKANAGRCTVAYMLLAGFMPGADNCWLLHTIVVFNPTHLCHQRNSARPLQRTLR